MNGEELENLNINNSKAKKTILVILIILIVVGLFACGYFFRDELKEKLNNNTDNMQEINDEENIEEENNTVATSEDILNAYEIMDSFEFGDLLYFSKLLEKGDYNLNFFEKESKKFNFLIENMNYWDKVQHVGENQTFPILKYEYFAKAYKELFNEDFIFNEQNEYHVHSFISDINMETGLGNKCQKEDIENCYYRWSNTYTPLDVYSFIITNVKGNSIYGKLKLDSSDIYPEKEGYIGNFEFEYGVNDNDNYYVKKLIITETNNSDVDNEIFKSQQIIDDFYISLNELKLNINLLDIDSNKKSIVESYIINQNDNKNLLFCYENNEKKYLEKDEYGYDFCERKIEKYLTEDYAYITYNDYNNYYNKIFNRGLRNSEIANDLDNWKLYENGEFKECPVGKYNKCIHNISIDYSVNQTFRVTGKNDNLITGYLINKVKKEKTTYNMELKYGTNSEGYYLEEIILK